LRIATDKSTMNLVVHWTQHVHWKTTKKIPLYFHHVLYAMRPWTCLSMPLIPNKSILHTVIFNTTILKTDRPTPAYTWDRTDWLLVISYLTQANPSDLSPAFTALSAFC